MCSIYGIIYFKDVTSNLLKSKMDLMSKLSLYRGPDDQETFIGKNCAIGINRLAIVGTNETANVIKSANKKIYSVMNGEISNFKELKRQNLFLQNLYSDSQIIIPLYENLGQEYINNIYGMFSIAIYNKENHELQLWRDPMGIKPLYYLYNSDYLIFASEIKMIYVAADRKPTLDLAAIDHILKYRFNPGRQTIFREINRVLPGEHIQVKKDLITYDRYWKLGINAANESKADYNIEEFRELFKKVIGENVQSDVKGGFFTSGGLDSSLVTALSLKEFEKSSYNQPFSIAFTPNPVVDEEYGKILEKFLNTKFEWISISDDLARSTLENIVSFYDEPLENPTHVGTYLMAKKAHEMGIKSILTGDGSDELFLGYERHTCWLKSECPTRNYAKTLWTMEPISSNILYNDDMKQVVTPIINGRNNLIEPINDMKQALLFEREERLVEYHNMRVDKMTMANSVEAKVPFLDRRIVEYSLRIPVDKLHGSNGKEWLKKVSANWLPDSIINRKKILFPSLPNQWLCGKGVNWCAQLLLDHSSNIKSIFNQKILFDYVYLERNGENPFGRLLWAIVTLELWLNNIKKWDKEREKI